MKENQQRPVNFQQIEEKNQQELDFHQQAVVNQQAEAEKVAVKKVRLTEENENKKVGLLA